MEHWYLPITILPGIGLLILSTSNQLIALSNEISERLKLEICNDQISQRKLKQLKLLNKGLVGLYIGAGAMVASGNRAPTIDQSRDRPAGADGEGTACSDCCPTSQWKDGHVAGHCQRYRGKSS